MSGSPTTFPRSGFTLVELLAAIGILALVTGLLVAIVYQLLLIPRWGSNQLTVDSDLRNAGLWLRRDGNESLEFTGTALTCAPFTFDTGSERGVTYTYTRSGTTLTRQASDTGQSTDVARHVSEVQCPAGTTTGSVVVDLTSSIGDVSGIQAFTVAMRVDE